MNKYCFLCGRNWSFNYFDGLHVSGDLGASLSSRRPGFNPRLVHVRFVGDEVTLGQVFLPVLRFSPVIIIPSILHTNFRLLLLLQGRRGKAWKASKKQRSFVNRGPLDGKVLPLFFSRFRQRAKHGALKKWNNGCPDSQEMERRVCVISFVFLSYRHRFLHFPLSLRQSSGNFQVTSS